MSDKTISVYLHAITGDYQRSLKEAADSTLGMARVVEGVSSRLVSPIRAIGAGFTAMGIVATVGVKSVIDAGAQYEATMNQFRAVSGATGEAFDVLNDQAMHLGSTTRYSATEAADAMYFLSSAGFSVAETYRAMPGILELAAAGNMDLATTADIATNVLSGYGMQVEDLSRVNDVLAVTFTNTNTNIQQLGEGMKYVAPVAQAAGIEFEETAAALGLLSNAGIQGTMAGTTLRGIITALIEPTGEAAEILDRLGINALDSTGNMRPLADIIDDLGGSSVTTGELMTIFGQRAGPGMAALLDQGGAALRNQTEAGLNSAGAAADIAAIQMEGFEGAMHQVRSAVDGAKNTLFQSGIGEWAEGVANIVRDLIDTFNNAHPAIHTLVAALTFGAATFGTLTGALLVALAPMFAMKLAVNGINFALQEMGITKVKAKTPLGLLTTAVKNATVAYQGYTTAAYKAAGATTSTATAAQKASVHWGAATTAAKGFGVILKSFLFNPVVLAITAVTTAIMYFVRRSSEARREAEELSASFETLVDETGDLKESAEQLVRQKFIDDGTHVSAHQLGISLDTLTDAAFGNAEAMEEVDRKVNAALGQSDSRFGLERHIQNVTGAMFDNKDIVDEVVASYREWNIPLAEAEGRYLDLEHAISKTDTQIGTMLWNAQQAGDAFRALSEETGLSEDELRELGVTADMTADEVRELAAAHNIATEATQSHTDATNDQIDAMRAAIDPLWRYHDSVRSFEDARRDLIEAEEHLIEVQNDSEASAQDLERAERRVEDAKRGVSRAALDLYADQRLLLAGVQDGTVSAAEYNRHIDEMAELLGLTEDEVNELKSALDNLPEQVETELRVTDHASATLMDVRNQLRGLPTSRTIRINTEYNNAGVRNALRQHTGGWAGQPRRFHNGGTPGWGSLRGDEVPSILQLGEFVLSRSMVSGLGGPKAVEGLADWASNPAAARPMPVGVGLEKALSALTSQRSGPVQHVEHQHIENSTDAGLVVDQLEFALTAGRL